MRLSTAPDAIDLLLKLGANARLKKHGIIVGEVASHLCQELSALGVIHDSILVVVGATLHDIGKIVEPTELTGPGHEHEYAGRVFLLTKGLSPEIAEMCVAHADWTSDSTIEPLIVATADHIWRGDRVPDLETLLVAKVATILSIEPWEAFQQVDPILATIATDGDRRLAVTATTSPTEDGDLRS